MFWFRRYAFVGSYSRLRPTRRAYFSGLNPACTSAAEVPGELTFAAVRQYVDEIVTVSEESLSRAVLATVERAKLVVEPAGAAGVAAVLDQPSHFSTPAVVVLSGGNIDPLLLQRVVAHGLAASGRYGSQLPALT